MKQNFTVNGFEAAGIAAGIKKTGRKDLGLLVSSVPASVAGIFTRNRVQAAPVLLDRRRIAAGRCRAVVVNSGNANCCNGSKGFDDAVAMASATAAALGVDEEKVLVASTGVIGKPLPIERIRRAVPSLADARRADGFHDLAEAIMTTDTVPKLETAGGSIEGKSFRVLGVAKGAGMIRPDMATMICLVACDVKAEPHLLQEVLVKAADRSFNRITIDGDSSTNDTVLLLANGTSGAVVTGGEQMSELQRVLDDVLIRLARSCVKDGEGATKLVEIRVKGAATGSDARRIADTVANSSLVKTALFGEDANWGRILAAAGRSGVEFDPERTDIYFDDVRMVHNGMGSSKAVEADATAVLKKAEFAITINLNLGKGESSVLTCDLSVEYVKINADYRS